MATGGLSLSERLLSDARILRAAANEVSRLEEHLSTCTSEIATLEGTQEQLLQKFRDSRAGRVEEIDDLQEEANRAAEELRVAKEQCAALEEKGRALDDAIEAQTADNLAALADLKEVMRVNDQLGDPIRKEREDLKSDIAALSAHLAKLHASMHVMLAKEPALRTTGGGSGSATEAQPPVVAEEERQGTAQSPENSDDRPPPAQPPLATVYGVGQNGVQAKAPPNEPPPDDGKGGPSLSSLGSSLNSEERRRYIDESLSDD